MKKNLLLSIALLPVLYVIGFFVPILNPLIVSIDGLNGNFSLFESFPKMDQIIEPLKGIAKLQFVSFVMPVTLVVVAITYLVCVVGSILILAGERTRNRGVKYVMNCSIISVLLGLFEIGMFIFATMQGPSSVQFPVGCIFSIVVGAALVALCLRYKKYLKDSDTRARYMKNIFTPMQKHEARNFYIMVIPFYIMVVIMTIFPFVWGISYSFTNYTGYNPDLAQGTGFNNYIRVISDPQTFSSLTTTVEIALFTVPAGLIMGVALAMLLNTNIKGAGFFRTIYYFPSIIPGVGVGIMWRLMFAQNGGVINQMLSVFGVDPVNWLGLEHCREALYIMILWGSAGGILTYLSALKAIPNELYESAAIDGANSFQRFYKITLPMISSTVFYNLVTGLIAAWQIMEQPVFLAGANLLAVPYQPNYTYLVHVFQQIFTNQRFGFGLAMIWIMFFGSIILNRFVFWTGNFWVFNENAPDAPKKRKKQKAIVAGN